MQHEQPVITGGDHGRLSAMLQSLRPSDPSQSEFLKALGERLANARIVPQAEVPRDVVTMNCLVGLRDLAANEKFTCTLAYPEQADLVKQRVAVTAPLGVALIGRRVGEVLEASVGAETRPLRVERVYYQPEAARDFHL